MAHQAITQEELFLPLVHFIADHGGEINRRRDDLVNGLADRLGLTGEERSRTTDGGRNQWTATVEYSRLKLIERFNAIGTGRYAVWPLTENGWRLANDPPDDWIRRYEAWKRRRRRTRPNDAPPPPNRPSGDFQSRIPQIQETLNRTRSETLRTKRNQALARALKEEYDHECQLCDPDDPDCPPIDMGAPRRYVEVHHIEGLAEVAERAEHGQLNDSEYVNLTSYHNVIVVCAYHHRLLHHYQADFQFFPDDLCFLSADGDLILEVVHHSDGHLKPEK